MIQLVHYMAATEWVRDCVDEAWPEYSDCVTWCLHYTLENNGTDVKEDRWREAMYVKVVEPLKYCYD